MRTNASTIGLAACLAGLTLAADFSSTSTSPPIEKNAVIIFGTDTWALPPTIGDSNKLLTIDATTVVLRTLYLKRQSGDIVGSAVSTSVPVVTTTMTGLIQTGAASPINPHRETRGRGPIHWDDAVIALLPRDVINSDDSEASLINLPADLPSENKNGNTGSVTILSEFNSYQYEKHNLYNVPLYIQVDWYDSAKNLDGSSFSPLFAVMNASVSVLTNETREALSQTNQVQPFHAECSGPVGSSCSTSPTSSSTPASFSTAPASTGSSAAENPQGSSNSSSDSPNGLSTGAIAGIAVGAGVVGLALIGAAIWFLCFRRRRSQRSGLVQHSNGYSSDGAGIMADKELPHVTDSPHSAYAPDRGALHDQGPRQHHHQPVAAAAEAATARGAMPLMGSHGGSLDESERHSFAPYSDRAPSGLANNQSQSSLPTGGARSPTPPITSRYAHLVEEGMTDDEIRRLEEEERALDVAIEDAGRASRTA
ncbi:hypothetical protein JX266_000324 [Neoarthrinium moseri]|nr:hypothetical protein JX266_000324 [Neoarthrinium moseri]